jgi:hypothetical protein
VNDNVAPVPNVASLPNVTGQCSANVTAPTATDNCAGTITGTTNSPLTYTQQGTYTITWTYNDGKGNIATQNQTVIVNDNTAPVALCKNFSKALVGGTATITTANINNGSSDNCGVASLLLSKTSFNCSNLGANNVTMTVTDINGNQSTCTSVVTITGGSPLTCSITSSLGVNQGNGGNCNNNNNNNNVYTGGVPTNIYLGYGPQSATLNAVVSPAGAGYTYNWSPSTYLSCTSCANPVFTPTAAGSITYTLTVTSPTGCTSTCTITMCTREVRAWILYGNGKKNVNVNKVVICHVPPGNVNNPQTLIIAPAAVPAHLTNHNDDNLGPCGTTCGAARPLAEEPLGELLTNDGFETVVYPNPTSGEFSIMINSENTSSVTGILYDMTGKKVMEFNDIRPNISYPVNATLSKGIYFLKLEQDGHQQSVRLIKD